MTSRSRPDSPFLSVAREYAERGWPVFPLIAREKRPLTPRGLHDASTDRNQVLEWQQLFPTANVGLRTGIIFDVLDIDGPEPVPYVQEILGLAYRHSGPVSNTGKGLHLFFAPSGGGNRAGLGGQKLDYRGDGGYVVAPPSIHPSGRVYRWSEDRDYRTPLPEIPERLLELVIKPTTREAKPAGIQTGGLVRGPKGLELTTRGQILAQRPDIYEVVEQELHQVIVAHGALWATTCIFHNDHSPSLVLYPDDTFHCYACEAHGDSLDLRRRVDITGRPAITGM
jgi:bifunctional DNA primase/polymerase-like protein/CHC2-type zinc finger protein